MTRTMFELWHFAEEALLVWQNLLYSPGETELQCGDWAQRELGCLQGSVLAAEPRPGAWQRVGSSLWCAQSLCSKRSHELRAASPGRFGDSSHWIGSDTGGDTSGDTGSCCPLPAAAPRTGGGCAWFPQLEAQGLSPGLPQQPTDTVQPARALDSKTRQKINSFGSCGFQRNWGEGGGRQRNRKIQSSCTFCLPVTSQALVYSSNP